MKLEFSRQFLKKYANIKFHENLFSGIRVVPCELTDGRTNGWKERHEEGSSCILEFCEKRQKC